MTLFMNLLYLIHKKKKKNGITKCKNRTLNEMLNVMGLSSWLFDNL